MNYLDDLFFTSDTHFGHKNIIKYSNRPFNSVEEMDRTIIANINSKVPQDGILYHFGDFAFASEERVASIIQQIHCKILFLDGNHDKTMRARKIRDLFSPLQLFKSFVRTTVRNNITQEIVPCIELKVSDKDAPRGEQMIVMCHYPMLTWNKAHRGSWHLHGHCHGSMRYPFPAKIMDVGVDPQGYFPVSYQEVKRHMAKVKPESLDHHLGD